MDKNKVHRPTGSSVPKGSVLPASQHPSIPAVSHPSVPASKPSCFLLTVDVEDWFQVENFKTAIPFSSWSNRELRVEKNTHKILDLFDTVKPPSVPASQQSSGRSSQHPGIQASQPILATFFILGWIAKQLPGLIREIKNRGHEVASHGFNHHLCSEQDSKNLQNDLTSSKKLLEDITGAPIHGYRAPSFSVSSDILKIIEDAGYRYDASYNSFDKHGRYGKLSMNGSPKKGIAYKISDNFYELPVSNLILNRMPYAASRKPFILPWSGGGYFRLLPLSVFNWGVSHLLKRENAYHFYFHPWEIDPDQPRVDDISRMHKFRHYVNLGSTFDKLKKLIQSFGSCRFQTLSQYIETLGSQDAGTLGG